MPKYETMHLIICSNDNFELHEETREVDVISEVLFVKDATLHGIPNYFVPSIPLECLIFWIWIDGIKCNKWCAKLQSDSFSFSAI